MTSSASKLAVTKAEKRELARFRIDWYDEDQREQRADGISPERVMAVSGIKPDNLNALHTKLEFTDSLGKRILAIREHYSMTQSEFADLLGVQQGSVSRWESDQSEPSPEIFGYFSALAGDLHVGNIRYGSYPRVDDPRKPIYEKPVRVVGRTNEVGEVDFLYELAGEEHQLTIARPREGVPHDDIVGIQTNIKFGGFLPLINQCWFFYRKSWSITEDFNQHDKAFSLLRVEDHRKPNNENFWLGLIMAAYEKNYCDLMYAGAAYARNVRVLEQWPILSIRTVAGHSQT